MQLRAALFPLVLSSVGCAGDHSVNSASSIGAKTLGAPSLATVSSSKDERAEQEAAIIAFQLSDEWKNSGRRCGSTEEPSEDFAARDAADCSFSSTTVKPDYAAESGAEIVIPVVFHVIVKSDGTTGNLPLDLLTSQIEVLNEDFNAKPNSPGAAGNNSKIRFVLADKKPDGSATNGIEYVSNDNYFSDPGSGLSPMKAALNWDPTRYFNIYTNDANGALGYATFPSQTAGRPEDGVVLLYSSVGRNAPDGGIYNLGRTATHEVGHYLGLFHTFQSSASCSVSSFTNGDLIEETPAQRQAQFECPQGDAANSCVGIAAAVDNYMNYTQDSCMTKFSAQQVNRMRCSVFAYRPGFIAGTPTPTPTPTPDNAAPVAAFSSNAQADGLTVVFADSSSDADGSVVQWDWNFGDGTPRSAEQNPTHTYEAPGTYAVTLTVMDDAGALSTTTASVSVTTQGNGGNSLSNGTPVSGLAGAKNEELFYTIDVPAGASNLRIALSGGSGDADLFVRFGDRPSLSTFDYRTKTSGNNDVVLPTQARSGTWHVMVRGYRAFSGVSLTGSYTTGSSGNLTRDAQQGTVESRSTLRYTIQATGGHIDLALSWTATADLDLYIADANEVTVAQATSTTANAETLSYDTKGKAGTYYLYVQHYSGPASVPYSLKATWQK